MFKERPNWKKVKPWFLLSTYVVILAAVMFNFAEVKTYLFWIISLFKPLFYGIAIAFVLNLPMRFIESKIKNYVPPTSILYKKSRGFSLVLTILLAMGFVTLLSVIVIPRIIDSLTLVVHNISTLLYDFVINIDHILDYLKIDADLIDLSQVENFLKMPWQEILTNSLNLLSSSASGLVSKTLAFGNSFALWFAGFMFSLYMLSSKESFIRQIKKVLLVYLGESKAKKMIEAGNLANDIFSSFIAGQMVEMGILGCIYYLAMKLFSMPFAELIATIIAITTLVPVFGPMFGMAIGAVLIFTLYPLKALGFVVMFQLIQEFENNFIYPRVVGHSVGLPGLWTLLSIFVFGGLFGIFGMLVAVPTTALVYTLFASYVNKTIEEKELSVEKLDKSVD